MNFARFRHDDIEELGVPVSTDLHDRDGLADHHREFALRSEREFTARADQGRRPFVHHGSGRLPQPPRI
jgi:acarbose 7IV-phosphotransferase